MVVDDRLQAQGTGKETRTSKVVVGSSKVESVSKLRYRGGWV